MRRVALVLIASAAAGCSAIYPFDYGVDGDGGPGRDAGASDAEVAPDGNATCPEGRTRCEDVCIETSADPLNCGGCDVACATDQLCMDSACQGLVRVEAGASHTCALLDSEDLYCWGSNAQGQLGVAGPDRSRPTRVFEDATSVCVGAAHTCVIRRDPAAVLCWGDGGSGQTGRATPSSRPAEIEGAPSSEPIGLACGASHTCVWTASGEAFCFGANTRGQLGRGTTAGGATPTRVDGLPVGAVQGMVAGGEHTCAQIDQDGVRELWCWGNNDAGQLGRGETGSSLVPVLAMLPSQPFRVAAGAAHTCAIVSGDAEPVEGELYCFGEGGAGQIGHGAFASSLAPQRIATFGESADVADVREVSAGRRHTCAVRASGALSCWGDGSDGQRGAGPDDHDATATPTDSSVVAHRIGAGANTTCGVVDRHLACWGYDGFGAIGIGATLYRPAPPEVPVALEEPVRMADASFGFTCAVHGMGDQLSCWGANGTGQLGDGTYDPSSSPRDVIDGVDEVGLGPRHACARLGTQVRCWGSNGSGQLGQGDLDARPAPTLVAAGQGGVFDLAVGHDFTCTLAEDGDGEGAYECWGANEAGQLGRGSASAFVDGPQGAREVLVGMPAGITAGDAVACVWGTGGARCWGSAEDSRVGTDPPSDVYSPAPVLTGDVAQIATRSRSLCSRQGEALHCWGWNPSGALGTPASPIRMPTVRPTEENMTFVAVGQRHLCVIAGGDLYCAGRGAEGQLGDGAQEDSTELVRVALPGTVTHVSAGWDHTCAVADDELYCWGHDAEGRLGSGRPLRIFEPTPVALEAP